jgi:hypothetical protein
MSTPPFDLFMIETNGGFRWLAATSTIEDAKTRVQALAQKTPGEFILLDQRTGNKMVLRPEAVGQ